ncbi:MAG TPA: hypothetical protein DCS93_06600 [Microscillaceae bacterium]|nr:hypothetical protein [Microscillaceae bacterium]
MPTPKKQDTPQYNNAQTRKGKHRGRYGNVPSKHKPVPKKHKYTYTFGHVNDQAYKEVVLSQPPPKNPKNLSEQKQNLPKKNEKKNKKKPKNKATSPQALILRNLKQELNQDLEPQKDLKEWEEFRNHPKNISQTDHTASYQNDLKDDLKDDIEDKDQEILLSPKNKSSLKKAPKKKPKDHNDIAKAVNLLDEQERINYATYASLHDKNKKFQEDDHKAQLNTMFNDIDHHHFIPNHNNYLLNESKEDINEPELKENVALPASQQNMLEIEEIEEEIDLTTLDNKKVVFKWAKANLPKKPAVDFYTQVAYVLQKAHGLGSGLKKLVKKRAEGEDEETQELYQLFLECWNQPQHFGQVAELATHLANMDDTKAADLSKIKALIETLNLVDENRLDEIMKAFAVDDESVNYTQLMLALFPKKDKRQENFYEKVIKAMVGDDDDDDGGLPGMPGMGGIMLLSMQQSNSNTSENTGSFPLNLSFMEQEDFQGTLLENTDPNNLKEQLMFAKLCQKKFSDAALATAFIENKPQNMDIGNLDNEAYKDALEAMETYLEDDEGGLKIAEKQQIAAKTSSKYSLKALMKLPVGKLYPRIEVYKQRIQNMNYAGIDTNHSEENWFKHLTINPAYQSFFKQLFNAFLGDETLSIPANLPQNILVQHVFRDKELLKLLEEATKLGVKAPRGFNNDTGDFLHKGIEIKNKKSLRNLLDMKQAMRSQKIANLDSILYACYHLDSQDFKYEPNIVNNLVKYYNKIGSTYQKKQFLQPRSLIKFRKLIEQKGDPSSYFTSNLKGRIHNFFVFEYEALQQLMKNYGSQNEEKKPLCLILHTDVNSAEFMQDRHLTKVITDNKLFTLVLEGFPNLAAYGKKIPEIANTYGGGKIDQLMIAAHGLPKNVELTHQKEFAKGNKALDDLLDVIFAHMDKKGDLPQYKQPNRRILLNACYTGTPTLAAKKELENLNSQAQKAFLSEFYKQNINLRQYIEAYAEKKNADIQHVIGANQPTTFGKLMEKDGKLTLADKFLNNKTLKKNRKEALEYALRHNYNPVQFLAYFQEIYARDDINIDWKTIIQNRWKNANKHGNEKVRVHDGKSLVSKQKFDQSLHLFLEKDLNLTKLYELIKNVGWMAKEAESAEEVD